MQSKKSSAQAVYNMLSFQYKPIEKTLKRVLSAAEYKKYQALSPMRKIGVLDAVAQSLNY